ncbi:MAG TPA: 2-isopropylmalate synthase [Candidatus Eremiobacteraceae bacterium]|nr:2-isopropylmalate synthase [Candidatus Eremiobacteraceae bacterium]
MASEQVRITVFDTTLRDGEQSPGCSMNHQEKLRLAQQIDRLGADVIEAGFPIASEGDFEAVKAIAAVIRRPIIAGLARACRLDIERAWEALKDAARPRIHVFLATSDIHLKYKLRITREECLAQARESVAFAKSLCDDVEFSPEDATRTDPEFLCQVLEAVVETGATTLNIPDTVGYTVPAEFGGLIATIRRRLRGIGNITISAHCHNDLGMAVANTMAAIDAGARQVECTINGIGERAGNAALEEIVMAMRVRPDRYPYYTAIAGEHLFAASQTLSEITGVPVQPNKAVTGRNAFAHEAGIHQDGVLKNPLTYEIMTPQSVGVPDSKLVLGKHSGRHALAIRCEQLGYQFDRRALDDIYRRFVRLADKIKHVEDHHLLELIRDTHKPATSATPLFEPLRSAVAATAAASAPSNESHRPFPMAQETNAFGVPLPVAADHHHDQQQEDYLWGV